MYGTIRKIEQIKRAKPESIANKPEANVGERVREEQETGRIAAL